MELLVQGAMVERFERKKVDVKHRLNDLVDDLFAFMLSEVSALAMPPLPSTVVALPAPPTAVASVTTAGGATITMIPANVPNAPNGPSVVPIVTSAQQQQQQQPPGPPPLQQQLYQQLQQNPARISVVQQNPQTQLQPEVVLIKEEMDETLPNSNEVQFASGAQSSSNASTARQQMQSSNGPSCSSQAVDNTANSASTSSSILNQASSSTNDNGYCCDSESECCQCYECMDESMVKVEINEDLADEDSREFEQLLAREHHLHTGPNHLIQRAFGKLSKRARSDSADGGPGCSSGGGGAAASSSTNGIGTSGQFSADDSMLGDEDEGESVSNNHQIETLALRCWMPGCESMHEDRSKLNQHLFFEHNKTLPYQCRVVGCGKQFEVRKDYWTHIRDGHTVYNCSSCGGKFNGYFPFVTHEFQLHEEGLFKCSREGCDFSASVRDQVYKHTKTEHIKFVCSHPGCRQSFECYSYLKRHRRIHSQVKPYRCKYPNCGYSSTQCGAVIQHIRIRHFKLPSSVKKQKELNIVDHRNPNDYLEVLTDLLN